MPFGTKHDPAGGPDIDFDKIYDTAIRPAIEDAQMEPIRADHEVTGGIIHKAMYERLLLCDFAVGDLTTANSNVFYELGVRHATRPATTVTIFASQQQIPFDVNFLRSLPYSLGEDHAFTNAEATALREALGQHLRELRNQAREGTPTDSPLFQLLDGYVAPDIARLKTDVFRERVQYSESIKRSLTEARRASDRAAMEGVQQALGPMDQVEVGVLVDLLLSYRAVEAWDGMVALYEQLPAAARRTVLVREQVALAYNRLNDRDRAQDLLEEILKEQGPSSETCGLLGRIFKDRWSEEQEAGNAAKARGWLKRAVKTYLQGFEADWRDPYPGINAVTLLEIRGDPASLARKDEVLPVVRYAVRQRLKGACPDYWDHATLLELAVIEGDPAAAEEHLGDALAAFREPWEPKTTANNLRLIRRARRARGAAEDWLDKTIAALEGQSR